MNILFVTDVSVSNATSGAERVLFEQSTMLGNRGHNVCILTRMLPEHKSYQEVIHTVREWRYSISQGNSLNIIKSILVNPKRLFESLQSQYSFDCINFHQPFSSFAVNRSPASKRIRKVYTCHSLSFEEFQSRNERPKNIIGNVTYFLNVQSRKMIERRLLNESDIIAVLSQFTKEKLWTAYNIPPRKIEIIPGGVDLVRFSPADDKREIRRRLNIPEEKMILFTLRDLEPRMGLENLIHASKEVIKVIPNAYVVIGGQGPLMERLVSLTQELGMEGFVKFVGFIPNEDLPNYYRMADIFILPTLELEGFGLITLESLASGVPVLGTPVGGTIEILGKLDSKYLFKNTRPESMAALIIEICQNFKSNPRLLQEVSAQCRDFVEAHYSWERNVDGLESLFQQGLEL